MLFLKNRSLDLTSGSIAKGVISLAVPLMLTSVMQQLYSTVDLLFASNILGANAAAALGVASWLPSCCISLFTGLSVGANVVVAMLFGGKDVERLSRGMRTSMFVGLASGVALSVAGLLFVPVYVQIMGTPKVIAGDTAAYLRIYFIAMVAVALYNMAAGIARAVGDSFTPLVAQLVGGLANVVANWFMLCVLHLGVEGIAAATFASNALAAAWMIAALCRVQGLARLRLRGPFSGTRAVMIMRIGIPVSIQMAAITLSNAVVQHQINLLGVAAIAAFSVYFKVELPIYYAIVAIGQATTTFVAQNHGAHDHERVMRGLWVCQALGLVVASVLSALMLVMGYWAFWLFNRDLSVIQAGLDIIAVTFPFYFLYAVLEVQGAAMRGLGHSAVSAGVTLAGVCGLRTALVLGLTVAGATLSSIAVTYPITWAFTAVGMTVCHIVVEKRHGHRIVPALGRCFNDLFIHLIELARRRRIS